jgi:hypothetical protein
MEVLSMSEDALNGNTDEAQISKELFLWYYDEYLPAVLPKEFWKEDIRYYKLLTDTVNIAGKEKVLVTVTAEAFGLLVWENCREKWCNFCLFKDQHGEKAPIPTGKEPGAENHLAKWSDGKEGQVLYGGWKEEAYDRFEQIKKDIKAWRKADEESGKVGQRLALKLMREKHNRTGATPADDKKGKRIRKKAIAPVAVSSKKAKLTVEDE